MPKVVLVVAAHSDDEAIGCGGTIARHVAEGAAVHLLFMTDGVGARHHDAEAAATRHSSAEEAASILGVASVQSFDFPDNEMDSVPLIAVVRKIEGVLQALQPDVIYTHHLGDLNVDHQIVHKAVMTACRPLPGFSVKEIYTFEVLSSSEWRMPNDQQFCPNAFVDVTSYIALKRAVLMAYNEEMRPEPHSRSVENILRLAALRGNAVGVHYAEAFVLARYIR